MVFSTNNKHGKKGLIGVIGSGLEDKRLNTLAEEVGSLIAEKGFVLVNGGLGGVMRASARGCKGKGGLTVGILPGNDPSEANEHIDIPIPTGLGEMRNLLVVRCSAVLIAVGGGYGTLSEIALALKTGTPVIGLETWTVAKEVIVAGSPKEAVEKAVSLLTPR